MGIWTNIRDAMIAGHKLPRANLGDQFLYQGPNTLLSRAAWIPGLGIGVKSASIFPENTEIPTIHGSMVIFDDQTGQVRGTIDSASITNLKTAADSVLGSQMLARKNARRLLIIGAGFVAEHLIQAYRELMPHIEDIGIWNRTPAKAEALAEKYDLRIAPDLALAAGQADIISSAVMVQTPILQGAWVRPGTHVDLIGAFTPQMREADDDLLIKSSLFCDCFDTTLNHIGEFKDPIARGIISAQDVKGDYYDLIAGKVGRKTDDEITLSKNGGGAHLDLMTAQVANCKLNQL